MSRAFAFDASACTGCKACQVACKDKNGLPVGVLWRRVYEVSGGGWEQQGAAWTSTVFAYNVSMACNHCAAPACVSACPTGACTAREDGIVSIDARKCVGCGYCAWACPYGAPQYSRDVRRMTKCDACRDLVDQELSPACVAACPMRALEFRPPAEGEERSAAHPYPLPDPARPRPRLVIKPHAAMGSVLAKQVANREEVRSGPSRSELPLVAFTLLAQAAAGMAVFSVFTGTLERPVLWTIGMLTALATLASLLHLGNVTQAWRAVANVRTSALSREIVALALFGAAWVVAWVLPAVGRVGLAITGVLLVYAMSEVYAVVDVPGWRRSRTIPAFAFSAVILGGIATLTISAPAVHWLLPLLAVAALIREVVRRRRFYDALSEKLM